MTIHRNFVLTSCRNLTDETTLPEKEYEQSAARKENMAHMFQSSRIFGKLGVNKDITFLKDIFYKATGKDLTLHEATEADLKKFKWELQDRENWIEQGFDGTASGFKVLQANLKRIPGGEQLYNDIARISAYHRQHTRDNNNKIVRIVDEVAAIAKDLDIDVNKLSDLEQQLNSAETKKQKQDAEEKIREFLGGYQDDTKRTIAGDMYLSIRDVMENTPVSELRRRNPLDPDGETIPWSTKHQEQFQAIQDNWFSMRKDLVGVLLNALRSEKRIISQTDRNEQGRRQLTLYLDKLESYIHTLEFQQTNDNSKQGRRYELSGAEKREFGLNGQQRFALNTDLGYMPHYVLNIVQDLGKFTDWAINQTNDTRTAVEVFADQVKLWESNKGIINRVKSRQDVSQEYYSKNPFLFLSKYMHEVSAYNYSNSLKESMIGVHNMYIKFKREGKNMGDEDAVNKFVEQTHDLLNEISTTLIDQGNAPQGLTDKLQRFTTSMMFNRTMSFNFRSGLRNSGQRLLEKIKLGYFVSGKARKYLEADNNIKELMNVAARKHGILWTQNTDFLTSLNKAWRQGAQEGTKGSIEDRGLLPGMREVTDSQGNKVVEMYDMSMLDKAIDLVEGVAQKGSIFHTFIENVNRFGSFKVAFATAHENLSRQPDWWIEQEMNVPQGTSTYEQRKQFIGRISGDMAYNVVGDVHFEYGKVFKPKVIQEGVGAILGQFQHYRASLANLQYETFKRGWRDIKTLDFNAKGAREAYRMATTYAIINALSVYSGFGIGNILSNDNWEWIKGKWGFLTAERDADGNLTEEGMKQAQQATYGVGSWGDMGPAVGTLIELGEIMHWWTVDMDSYLPLLENDPRRFKTLEDDDYNYKLLRLANIQLARLAHHSGPALMNQNVWKAIMTETGLYQSYDNRKKSEAFFQWARDTIGVETTGSRGRNQVVNPAGRGARRKKSSNARRSNRVTSDY